MPRAEQLATLLGGSEQSVYNWETKKATPRKEQLAAIIGLHDLGKRQAQERLDALKSPRRRKRGKAARYMSCDCTLKQHKTCGDDKLAQRYWNPSRNM